MRNTELLRIQLNHLITQARQDIYMLTNLHESCLKKQTLQRLWNNLNTIQLLTEILANEAITTLQEDYGVPTIPTIPTQPTTPLPPVAPGSPIPPAIPIPNQRTFTVEELTMYDGKNGRPAYVAVNGIVYDVTNSAAWAAATHFGLTAGKELTAEFASCHAGQPSLLERLPIVGRIA